MFLEFTRPPSDYVVEARAVSENQYSVFGPTPDLAATQAMLQKALVVVAVASVPVMLLVKPVYLHFRKQKVGKEVGVVTTPTIVCVSSGPC